MERSFDGLVVGGDRLGRTIGFPTANLQIKNGTEVPAGVFACRAILQDGSVYPAMMNVGYRPTVNSSRELRVEVHLLGFSGNLYGQSLHVEMVEFVRGEQKFSGLDALKEQLQKDRMAVDRIFSGKDFK